MSKWTAEDFAQQIGTFRRELAGAFRRMHVSLTSGGMWQTIGHLLFDGVKEAREIELWPGIGFFARPPKGSAAAEALVVNVGGQNNPAIVATRDEATRKKVDDVADDEAAMFNTLARVHVKSDGTLEARTHAGAAAALATKADIDAVISKLNALIASYNAHVHPGVTTGGGITLVTTSTQTAAAAAAGTQKFKAE